METILRDAVSAETFYELFQMSSKLDFLRRQYENAQDWEEMESLLRSIGQIKTPEALEFLEEKYESAQEWGLMELLLKLIGQFQTAEALEFLQGKYEGAEEYGLKHLLLKLIDQFRITPSYRDDSDFGYGGMPHVPAIIVQQPQPVPQQIVKETIVKVRCQSCKTLYDESEDRCPTCGGR